MAFTSFARVVIITKTTGQYNATALGCLHPSFRRTNIAIDENTATAIILNDERPVHWASMKDYVHPDPTLVVLEIELGIGRTYQISDRRYNDLDADQPSTQDPISLPEIPLAPFEIYYNHVWFRGPTFAKTLINLGPRDAEPTFIGGRTPALHFTLELRYEYSNHKITYRVLPYIDIDSTNLAYPSDNIFYTQSKAIIPRFTRSNEDNAEGNLWVLEPFSHPSIGGFPSETRKSGISPPPSQAV